MSWQDASAQRSYRPIADTAAQFLRSDIESDGSFDSAFAVELIELRSL